MLVWKPPKGLLANSADTDKTPQNAASDQGLHNDIRFNNASTHEGHLRHLSIDDSFLSFP